MPAAVLSQLPIDVELRWVEDDPVSLSIVVQNVDWSGTYDCDVRRTPATDVIESLVVAAVYDTTHTTFSITLPDSSALIAGEYVYDIQQVAGLTRFSGKIVVSPQVTT